MQIWGNLFVSIEFVNRTEINDSTRLHTFLPLLATSIAGVVVMTLVARPPVSKESEEARANESVWDGIKSSFGNYNMGLLRKMVTIPPQISSCAVYLYSSTIL